MRFLGLDKNYEKMTNKELLEIAKKKGIIVTPAVHNRLSVVRMVRDDRQGYADRQEFIARLQAVDSQNQSSRSELIAIFSLLVSISSLVIAFIALK